MSRTVAEIEADIVKVEAARDRALESQDYSIGSRSSRRPDLKVLSDELVRLRRELARAQGGGGLIIKGATPV